MKEDDEDIIRDIGNCLIQTHNFKKVMINFCIIIRL